MKFCHAPAPACYTDTAAPVQASSWCAGAHAALDRAVTDDETSLARLLALNLERAAAEAGSNMRIGGP